MDILDLSCSLEDGDIVEVYVKHLIDDAVVDPTLILLENVPHRDIEEFGSTFNKVNEQSGVGEDPFTTFDTRSASTPTHPTTTSAPRSPSTTTTHSTTALPTTTAALRSPFTKNPPTTIVALRSPSTKTPVTAANPSTEDADLVSGAVESDFLEKEDFDYSTEDSVESECGLVGDDNEDYGSDVHEEVRELRLKIDLFKEEKEKREYQLILKRSFEIDEDEFSDECVESERVNLPRTVKRRRRPNNHKIIHDPTAKKVVWQLGMVFANVNEFRRAVLQENIHRSMNCNNEFNGVDGFEVREGPFQHSVDLGMWTCSCRATYMRAYANVLQPVTNMEMWPVSTNPTVAPPEIKSMLGKPGKLRKKEAGESKKSGKLSRTGLAMTCSICNVRGHNKRGCPQRV
ncbi:hypothetical protein MTR67_026095 [Solanum verrucosum]|uniref:Uncharacterized protein n=1 Tax=Solanum verrucosum TaxID=315347 RepID=A0AAF0TZ26_SOLVR|nr:hypothetical protein MTR67_026095 [Solanum verrucosum]